MGKPTKGSYIDDLPDTDTDNDAIDSKELTILNNILNIKNTNPEEYNKIKYILYATAIFMVLSLPFSDRILELALPMANSWLILVGLKTVIFFLAFYIICYVNRDE